MGGFFAHLQWRERVQKVSQVHRLAKYCADGAEKPFHNLACEVDVLCLGGIMSPSPGMVSMNRYAFLMCDSNM